MKNFELSTNLNWGDRDDVKLQADEMRHMLGELENIAEALLLHHRAQKEATKPQTGSAFRRDVFNVVDGIEHVIEHIDDADLYAMKLELGGVRETLLDIEGYIFGALTKEKEPGYWMLWGKAIDAHINARDACAELLGYDDEFSFAESNTVVWF